jgi:cyclase
VLAKRIIACLDVADGKVVKGVKFRNHEILGDPIDMSLRYRDQGVDELVFYDITASSEKRRVSETWIQKIAACLDIPFCVAGGIKSPEDARLILNAGADKVSINSPAINRPELISELAQAFGQQCVVVGIDSQKIKTGDGNDTYRVFQYTGSESTTKEANLNTLDWIKTVQTLGAGEIVLNCMGSDGTKGGFDLTQLQAARKVCQVPLIASGGAGSSEDFCRVFSHCDVDGALAAGVFHRKTLTIPSVKNFLISNKIEVRPSE